MNTAFLRGAGRRIVSELLNAALPQSCAACRVSIPGTQGLLCPACRETIQAAAALPYCPRCGRTSHPATLRPDGCGQCRSEAFWNVAGLARVAPYHTTPLRQLLTALKFRGQRRCLTVLGELLSDALRKQAWLGEVELFVPVPMHWLRRWQRPCDHARLLAEALSTRLRLPTRVAAVRRRHYSPSQIRALSRQARFENVRDCFAPARSARVQGRTVCIVDNLLVSGATVHEVCKVLRRAGAGKVYAAVVARSNLPGEQTPRDAPGDPRADQRSAYQPSTTSPSTMR